MNSINAQIYGLIFSKTALSILTSFYDEMEQFIMITLYDEMVYHLSQNPSIDWSNLGTQLLNFYRSPVKELSI